jgi:hypothetical protein
MPFFRQVGDLQGEAKCIQRLGGIALGSSSQEEARARYMEALALYQRTEEPYSIGMTHRRLAELAGDEAERQSHVDAARAAWTRIDRPDLVLQLDSEFGTGGSPEPNSSAHPVAPEPSE